MRAVLRLWWTYFTAVPLQRGLGWVAVGILSLTVVGHFLSGESFWLPLGYTIFGVLAAFPALFAAPALFRSLSAPRMYQLLPYFRLRMLVAVGLTLGALFVLTAIFILWLAARPVPLAALHLPLAFLVGIFLVLFLMFSDWRWIVVIPLAAVALVLYQRAGPEGTAILSTLPAWTLSATALGASATFATWYLRVRQVRPVMLMPQPRSAGFDAARPISRAVATRALLAAAVWAPRMADLRSRLPAALFSLFIMASIVAGITWALRFLSFASMIFPVTVLLLFCERSIAIVRQSRLIWLKTPGSRDAVRAEIEKVLWRNLAIGIALLAGIAVLAVSPLAGADPADALLGLAVTAGAALCGSYVAFAGAQSVATYLWGFGSLLLVQFALLTRPAPSFEAVAIVVAVELAGTVLMRALAVRRWRRIDWLRLRPLPALVGIHRWP